MSLLSKLFAKPVTSEAFLHLAAKEFSLQGQTVTHNPQEFSLLLTNGNIVYLHNIFTQWNASEAGSRPEKLSRFVRASIPDLSPSKYKAEFLRPVVRSSVYYSMAELRTVRDKSDQSREAVHRKLAPGLSLGLALDSELSLTLINQDTLAALDLDFESALQQSLKNLREHHDQHLTEHSPGLFVGDWNDGYSSSRMLLDEVIDSAAVRGNPIVHIPTRDRFFLTSEYDVKSIELMLRIGAETDSDAYPLSPELYVRSTGTWRRWIPHQPASRAIIDQQKRLLLSGGYAEQKALLEEVNESAQVDWFVASYSLYNNVDSEGTFSASVWSNSIPTLLPKTDRVILLIDQATKETLNCPWSVIENHVGTLLSRVPGLDPPRYRVESFPDEKQLKAMRAEIG